MTSGRRLQFRSRDSHCRPKESITGKYCQSIWRENLHRSQRLVFLSRSLSTCSSSLVCLSFSVISRFNIVANTLSACQARVSTCSSSSPTGLSLLHGSSRSPSVGTSLSFFCQGEVVVVVGYVYGWGLICSRRQRSLSVLR